MILFTDYGILKYLRTIFQDQIMRDTTMRTTKSCALCDSLLPQESSISICGECIKVADCCNGLEDLSDNS